MNSLSKDMKSSKAQLSKIIQSGGFFGRLFEPLPIAGLSLMKNVLQPLSNSVLKMLGLTVTASVTDEKIHKKVLGSGPCESEAPTLVLSNE